MQYNIISQQIALCQENDNVSNNITNNNNYNVYN